jgi:hypothetical protein
MRPGRLLRYPATFKHPVGRREYLVWEFLRSPVKFTGDDLVDARAPAPEPFAAERDDAPAEVE